jgi:hypothetical protein
MLVPYVVKSWSPYHLEPNQLAAMVLRFVNLDYRMLSSWIHFGDKSGENCSPRSVLTNYRYVSGLKAQNESFSPLIIQAKRYPIRNLRST